MTPAEEVLHLWSQAAHETNYRTIASRAYYACFNRGMSYAIRHGMVPTRRGDDHGLLAEFLRDARKNPVGAHLAYRIGADRLRRLRKLRRLADYDQEFTFVRGDAEQAVSIMTEILSYMDQIEARPPE